LWLDVATSRCNEPGGVLVRFRVTIHYREPGYASTRDIPERDYRGSFNVTAGNESEAERLAIERFKHIWSKSGVGWERRITRVSCEPIDESKP
jgi:hypothetical protein